MRNFDAIIFDMDGLIVDTEAMMQKEVKNLLEEMGFFVKEDMLLQLIGLSDTKTEQTLKNMLGEAFPFQLYLEQLLKRKELLFENQPIAVKAGLWELLAYLKKQDIKSILATGSSRKYVQLVLNKTGLSEQFHTFVCKDDVKRGKPFAYIFLKAVEKLQLPKERCLILEDSQNGIIAAKNAEIPVFFIKDLVMPEEIWMNTIYAQGKTLSDVIAYLE